MNLLCSSRTLLLRCCSRSALHKPFCSLLFTNLLYSAVAHESILLCCCSRVLLLFTNPSTRRHPRICSS
ncbi:hypothetical protein SLEP1_g24377 [Rubroshorea leprosula]|uniref:Uncharacterized protein n=1 Tax=Rubroshorea leprosula TaxID=152421 RepID=A0AAV5JPY2_9ROSI|nr:hypothetical protein SLEP1_g24377 [Rubroshorea leprosula]